MLWYHVVILSVIQGLTEFLPVSSSAHLILPSQLFLWPDQGLVFDVAVHVGTLIAVVGYFWRDIFSILRDWFGSLAGNAKTDNSRLGWWVILATLPAMIAGATLNNYIEANLRSIEVIAYTTIGFGVLLWFSDHFFSQTKVLRNLQLPNVAMIGLAQVFALIPGTSRSGVTMTAARLMGFDRSSAARFSFLLSIPVIVAAGSYKSMELVVSSVPVTVDFSAILWGVVLSALSAYLCIHLFLKWLNQIGFLPFMLYRLVLGVFLLWLVKMS